MRSKQQIVDQLNKLPKPFGTINQDSQVLTKIMIEILVDVRDELTALTIILGSVQKVAYRSP